MSHGVRVLCRPATASGFALAGLVAETADEDAVLDASLRALLQRPEVGVVLLEESLYRTLAARPADGGGPGGAADRGAVSGPGVARRTLRGGTGGGTAAPRHRLPREAPVTGARVIRAAGALVEAAPLPQAALYEIVRVGHRRLLGEVIRVQGEVATVQVFEDTAGLALEEPVEPTGAPLQAELGPGLLGSVLDGIGRPLSRLAEQEGNFLSTGHAWPRRSTAHRRWAFTPTARSATRLAAGDVLGTVVENEGVVHRILVPPGVTRRARRAEGGVVHGGGAGRAAARTAPRSRCSSAGRCACRARWRGGSPPTGRSSPASGCSTSSSRWPKAGRWRCRAGSAPARPSSSSRWPSTPMPTSWSTSAAASAATRWPTCWTSFPRSSDPRTGRSLMDRTVLVVNTSNMPVAAREASVYLGLTIAEYYRDMGYRVALMADSACRAGRRRCARSARGCREMPGEEGYPTYLGNRLGKLFERAGRATALGAAGSGTGRSPSSARSRRRAATSRSR